MSNIYNLEPPTKGKVILNTTVGEIEVELWSKECPKTCRNFIQLCMEGYYNKTIFHRVVKDFIVQGGDPTGTGEGGESIYGEPFKDEFHSRLKFNRRGLLGMANSEANDNASQFFFTLGDCKELNRKHTLFGKIGGATVFNMIKLNESELVDERPVRPERILSVEIIHNPFEDIVPRNRMAKRSEVVETKVKQKGVKNFGLLSFGDEAEEDEEELEENTFKGKVKSAHDVGDPSLISKKVAVENSDTSSSDDGSGQSSDRSSDSEADKKHKRAKAEEKIDLDSIKSKLKKASESKKTEQSEKKKEPLDEKELKKKQTQDEIKKLQKELANKDKKEMEVKKAVEVKKEETKIVKEYKEDIVKYDHLKRVKRDLPDQKKRNKEDKTLELLKSFRSRLFKAKEEAPNESMDTEDASKNNEDVKESESEGVDSGSIWTHRLQIDDEIKQKVIDANVADNDRWDIYDPRNPLNKRKREESKHAMKDRKRSGNLSKYVT